MNCSVIVIPPSVIADLDNMNCSVIVISLLPRSKDKALYRACGKETDGKQCNKKVVENGDDTYR